MFAVGVVVDDGVDRLRAGTWPSMVLRKRMNSWCRWGCILRPIMVPSRIFSAANRVVVPFVVVDHRPDAALLHRQAGLGAVERPGFNES